MLAASTRSAQGRSPLAGAAALLLLLLLAGCRIGVRRADKDPVGTALAACDALIDGAPSARALDDHLQCLLEVHAEHSDDGRVHARVARGLHARARAYPDPARDDLQTARSWALRCLALRAGFAGRLEASSGRVTERVVAAVPAEDAACLTWGAISWARWLQARGVLGAAIDLDAVQALARRAVELAPDQDLGLSQVALGLSLGIVPAALDRDAVAAGDALAEARRQAPGRLATAVAAAELVYGPEGDEAVWRRGLEAVLAATPATGGIEAYEDLAAQAQARQLLDLGMPPRATW